MTRSVSIDVDREQNGRAPGPSSRQNANLLRSIAATRLGIINELHATYGAETKRLRATVTDLRKRIRLGLKWLDVAERKVNDNPAHGPGAPHVPGLFEVRNAMAVLRRPLQKGKRR